MCIRDSPHGQRAPGELPRPRAEVGRRGGGALIAVPPHQRCLLYTSDAADERSSVDLGGRRIIKNQAADELHSRRRSHLSSPQVQRRASTPARVR